MAGVAIRLLLGGCVAFVVALYTGGAAVASSTEEPQAGDPRAHAVSGNAVTCARAGLPGSIVTVTAVVSADNSYVTITSVPDGTSLTGTAVKGGPAFNVYPAGALTLLHAPTVPGGHPVEVSHFLSCGIRAHHQPSIVVPPATHDDRPSSPDHSQPNPAAGTSADDTGTDSDSGTTEMAHTDATSADDSDGSDGSDDDAGKDPGNDTEAPAGGCDATDTDEAGNPPVSGNGGTNRDPALASTGPEFPAGPAIVLGLVLVGLGSLFFAPPRRYGPAKQRRRD